MADIAKDAKIVPAKPALAGLSRLSTCLWSQAWKHADGTVSGDADALHDMRVAIRRLRSLLQNFEGEKSAPVISAELRREFREHRAQLAKLGDALGAVRDYDVLDDYLKLYARQRLKTKLDAQPEYSGLLTFEQFLQEKRAAAFSPMVKRVNKAQRPGDLRESFARWALGLPAAHAPDASLQEVAHKLLAARLDEIGAHASTLDNADDEIGHHELRKSLRRLRYTLETLGPCFNASSEAIKNSIKTLTALQDVLGEMQDRSVLHEKVLKCFGKDESTLPPDVAAFLTYGANRKKRLLGQVRTLWKTHQDQQFFESLRELQEH